MAPVHCRGPLCKQMESPLVLSQLPDKVLQSLLGKQCTGATIRRLIPKITIPKTCAQQPRPAVRLPKSPALLVILGCVQYPCARLPGTGLSKPLIQDLSVCACLDHGLLLHPGLSSPHCPPTLRSSNRRKRHLPQRGLPEHCYMQQAKAFLHSHHNAIASVGAHLLRVPFPGPANVLKLLLKPESLWSSCNAGAEAGELAAELCGDALPLVCLQRIGVLVRQPQAIPAPSTLT